jgi:DNA replication and repair protein RecF
MRLTALQTIHFRNLASVLLEAHPRFNVLSGDNAQGKTNLLEAIYLCGTLRSFRAGKTEELIAFGQGEARVRARVEKEGIERLLEVRLSPGHKNARIDGKGTRASDYFGGMNVVLFQPDDLRLPRGAPSGRRRFVDRAVFSERPQYLAEAQAYERVLRSRNAVLREPGPPRPELLEVYDEQLARAAVPIVLRRATLVAELAPRAAEVFHRLTRTGRTLELLYRPAVAERDPSLALDQGRAIEAAMRQQLVADHRRDQARGATSAGPHTDDLDLSLDGRDAQKYASQGQLRAIVLALKIAEIEHLTERLGDAPILLLDDVSSELDATRNAQLFEFLDGRPGQVFITTTDPRHVRVEGARMDVRVVAGALEGPLVDVRGSAPS